MGAAGPRTPRHRALQAPDRRHGWYPGRAAAPSGDPDERIRQLEARVAELEASGRKLAPERDILRKAAKYFAGETNW